MISTSVNFSDKRSPSPTLSTSSNMSLLSDTSEFVPLHERANIIIPPMNSLYISLIIVSFLLVT